MLRAPSTLVVLDAVYVKRGLEAAHAYLPHASRSQRAAVEITEALDEPQAARGHE